MSNIKMEIVDGFDNIISEKGNTYISLRKVKWSENAIPKLDLRKYYTNADGEEVISKGVCFDDEGADELTRVLVDSGYGNTREVIDSLSRREDFEQAYNDSINGVDETPDEENYIDIRSEMLG